MNTETIEKMIDLLKTTYEGAKYALNSYKTCDIKLFADIMENVENAIASINQNLLNLSTELEISQRFNIIANIQNSINSMESSINKGDFNRGGIILEFEIIPLLAELKEDLYFFTLVYPDKNRMDKYYKNEFAKNHENTYVRGGKARFDVSLVVTAWNQLDYTKQCIESLFKYTDLDGLNCELITVNHGSNDGTEDFFETLPHEKKINLKSNMCMAIGSYVMRIVEGRYFVCISNDVVLTKNWLENLLICMKSDNRIAMAGPASPNNSNMQSIDVSYSNVDEMNRFAEKFNISNPNLWDERIKLCPPIAIINMDIVNKTGIFDRYFRYMEFCDDDEGVLFRRNGYKQILLRDTFCHHFGSITLGVTQKRNNTLEKSRQLFLNKHGFDAWMPGCCYDLNIIQSLQYDKKEHVNILGIDAGLGSTPLQIKNELRHKGNYDVHLYNFTTEEQIAPDLEPYSDFFTVDQIENIKTVFGEQKFDYIYLGKGIECYHDYEFLIQILKERLQKGGQLVVTLKNPYYIESLHISHQQIQNTKKMINWLEANQYSKCLTRKFCIRNLSAARQEIPSSMLAYYDKLLESCSEKDEIGMILKTTHYQFFLK